MFPVPATRLTGLDANEASALLLSGLGTALGDIGPLEAATRTEMKIPPSLSKQVRDKAVLVAGRFLLDPLHRFRSQVEAPLLQEIATSV